MGTTDRFLAAVQRDPTLAYVLLDRDGQPIWASPTLFRLVDLDLSQPNPMIAATHPEDAGICAEVFQVERGGKGDDRFTVDCRYELVARLRSPDGRWRRMALRLLNLVDDPDIDGYLLQVTLANQEFSTVAAFDIGAAGGQMTDVVRNLLEALETGGTGHALAAVFDTDGRCVASSPSSPIGPGDLRSDARWRAVAEGRVDLQLPIMAPRAGLLGTLETCSAFTEVRPFTRSLAEQIVRRVAVVLQGDADRSRLLQSATHDALTGLLNRWSFREAFDCLPDARALSVFFIDIDRFKEVNDTFGHEAGDAVLVDVARRLTDAAGPRDLVARFGGDEFVLVRVGDGPIRRDQSSNDALAASEVCWLAAVLNGVVMCDGVRIPLSCSIGLAGGTTRDRRDLVARADAEMYEQKRRRRSADRKAGTGMPGSLPSPDERHRSPVPTHFDQGVSA